MGCIVPEPITVTVQGFANIAKNTVELCLNTPAAFTFQAGQYVSLTIPSLANLPGTEGFHDFSIASMPSEKGVVRIAFRKSNSTFKQALLQLEQGDKLQLEGPSGVFTFPNDQLLVAIAGGIGVTAFSGAVTAGRRFDLLYYNHRPETAAYLTDLQQRLNGQLHAYFDTPSLEQLSQQLAGGQRPLWYVAGPPGFVSKLRALLKTLLVDDVLIRTEEFTGYDTIN